MARNRKNRQGVSRNFSGTWFKPPAVSPTIKEQKWKYLTLKVNIAGSGDSGAVEVFTPKRIREQITLQTRVPQPDEGEVMMIRLHRVSAYAVPGIGESGAQTYPSVKLYVYDLTRPLAQQANSWSMDTREAHGTLSEPARIGYTFPPSMQVVPIVSQDTNIGEMFKTETYHCSRAYAFFDISFSYTDE